MREAVPDELEIEFVPFKDHDGYTHMAIDPDHNTCEDYNQPDRWMRVLAGAVFQQCIADIMSVDKSNQEVARGKRTAINFLFAPSYHKMRSHWADVIGWGELGLWRRLGADSFLGCRNVLPPEIRKKAKECYSRARSYAYAG